MHFTSTENQDIQSDEEESVQSEEMDDPNRYLDDGDEYSYQKRLKTWAIARRKKRCIKNVSMLPFR